MVCMLTSIQLPRVITYLFMLFNDILSKKHCTSIYLIYLIVHYVQMTHIILFTNLVYHYMYVTYYRMKYYILHLTHCYIYSTVFICFITFDIDSWTTRLINLTTTTTRLLKIYFKICKLLTNEIILNETYCCQIILIYLLFYILNFSNE